MFLGGEENGSRRIYLKMFALRNIQTVTTPTTHKDKSESNYSEQKERLWFHKNNTKTYFKVQELA